MNDEKRNWLDRTPIPSLPWLTIEVLIFAVILVTAVVSRYYNLGARAMSHAPARPRAAPGRSTKGFMVEITL